MNVVNKENTKAKEHQGFDVLDDGGPNPFCCKIYGFEGELEESKDKESVILPYLSEPTPCEDGRVPLEGIEERSNKNGP